MAIIGFDFGNYNTFPCFISDFDPGTRMGGIVHDLLPSGLQDGIPSVFYYSEKVGVLCGEEAVRTRARPQSNRIRNLKRHLGDSITLDDGSVISYDDAITSVIQHCVRRANEQLHAGWQMTTNQISLSYPASYTAAQLQRLIELAEQATLADGTPVKVVGTIREPAAAALDYLAEYAQTKEETTVLTYDLGGGTFDLALVAAYPAGRKNQTGGTYYYDVIAPGGLPNVGGTEFDKVVYQLILSKLDVPLKPAHKSALRRLAENIKIALSTDDYVEEDLFYEDDYLPFQITQQEFATASRDLLMQTIDATREMLRNHPNQQPELILLTGGASQMPMVKRELEKALPQFEGKIVYFRPSRAIAYGAARFGTAEENQDVTDGGRMVQQRTMFDIGVRYYERGKKDAQYIYTHIPANTPIPYTGVFEDSYTHNEGQQYSTFRVFEAVTQHPDQYKTEEDYVEIMKVTLDYGAPMPKGTQNESRLHVDERGVLTIQARTKTSEGVKPVENTVQLTNLSSSG